MFNYISSKSIEVSTACDPSDWQQPLWRFRKVPGLVLYVVAACSLLACKGHSDDLCEICTFRCSLGLYYRNTPLIGTTLLVL